MQQILSDIGDEYRERIREELSSDMPDDIYSVVDHVLQHLFDPELTVRQLKEDLGIREQCFSSRFRYHTGYTPVSFIRYHRSCCAREIIDECGKGISLSFLTYELGFNSPAAFTNAFRSVIGVAPARYRQKLESEIKSKRKTENEIADAVGPVDYS